MCLHTYTYAFRVLLMLNLFIIRVNNLEVKFRDIQLGDILFYLYFLLVYKHLLNLFLHVWEVLDELGFLFSPDFKFNHLNHGLYIHHSVLCFFQSTVNFLYLGILTGKHLF